MFKSAATKLSHSPTIRAVVPGNSDLRSLHEVIATTKVALQSLQRLSTGFGKSTDALRAWACGEGEDLEDTFSACATLLGHWLSSLATFAGHIASVRKCLKAVRTREEALGGLRRNRRSLMSKADSTDKKLNKMSPDDKDFQQQTVILMSLREQIRIIGVNILYEEASLSDWKRVQAKEWMVVLFGGLLECSAKGAVVATSGAAVIECVPTNVTQPGLPRAQYFGHLQVELLMTEAEDMLREIASASEDGASFVSGAGISFFNEADVSEAGDGTTQTPSGLRTGDVPGNSSPSPNDPIQPHLSSTLSNNPFPAPDYQPNLLAERELHRTLFVDENTEMWSNGKGKAKEQDEPLPEHPVSDLYPICGICFEQFQVTHSPISASLTANSSARLPFGLRLPCPGEHTYCISCVSEYIKRKLDPSGTEDANTNITVFPIPCPECPIAGWRSGIQDDVAERVFDAEAMSIWYHRKLLDSLPRQYCPNPQCSVLVQIDDDHTNPKGRCPACFQWACVRCKAMWHKDMTCEEYQSLPLDERSPEDQLVIELAKSEKWRRCPGCHAIVERNQGCNHMTCLCGMEFCFRCGSTWCLRRKKCSNDPPCELFDEGVLNLGVRG